MSGAGETPISKEIAMTSQETMDGSPARVVRTLEDLAQAGKFASYYHRRYPGDNPVVIDVMFQAGPISEVGVNGCAIEDVIDVLVIRLEGFQKGPFRCRENALAITKLEEAKHWLNERTRKRQAQGVEGHNVAHQD